MIHNQQHVECKIEQCDNQNFKAKINRCVLTPSTPYGWRPLFLLSEMTSTLVHSFEKKIHNGLRLKVNTRFGSFLDSFNTFFTLRSEVRLKPLKKPLIFDLDD